MTNKDYADGITKKINFAYKIANTARSKSYDPEETVNILVAKNMAERVEGLVSVVAPHIMNSGIPKRIKELEDIYGKLNWRVAFKISLETAQQKFCGFETQKEAIETGIRIGLAYLTLGVVASPLEGFVELKFRKRADGKEYLALMYSGPIRSAGGTAGALSVIIADYIRKNMGYDVYDPSEKEIRRMVTELYDYHERVTNLQYLPSEKEIRFLVSNLPIQIDGDASEEIEVSNYKDTERIETNRIRSGPCLVLGECVAQKAAKIWPQIKKWGHEFGIEHWSFLQEFVQLQKETKAKEKSIKKEISPIYTYIQDLVAGRPVLTHPLAVGGFRLRYGRCRTSGYSASAIHPATMIILNKYIAIGTQLKVERPGKATAISVCDCIEGPIVKLNDGSVIRLDGEHKAKQVSNTIKEILFLGDILISYGDFFNRAHPLPPAGYCEEWWSLEVEKGIVNMFGSLDYYKLSQLTNIDEKYLENIIKNSFFEKPDAKTAIILSKTLMVPLHPYYTYHWKTISKENFMELLKWLASAKIESEGNNIKKIILPKNEVGKRVLEVLGAPHILINDEFTIVENEDAEILYVVLRLDEKNFYEQYKGSEIDDVLDLINSISKIKLRDKSGIFIGARMGRPEKAKVRKLDGEPHTLFPIGKEGGKLRSFQSEMEVGSVEAEFPTYFCGKCKKETILSVCEQCDTKTTKTGYCNICGLVEGTKCRHGEVIQYKPQRIDIGYYFKSLLKKLNMQQYPDLIKGVRGTSSKNHIPEHFAKGILRAKYDIPVNRDGTTRYDMTQLPITHFKPKEIGTSVEELKDMGYHKDIYGLELTDSEQILELKSQDIILPKCEDAPEAGADKVLYNISLFIDELLVSLYHQKRFYNLKSEKELIGHLVVVLAPHTSAGIAGRIIGFSKTQAFFAHPLLHAATRRDCLSYDSYVSMKENGIWKIEKIGALIENLNPTQKADNFGTFKKDISNIYTWSNPGQSEVVEVTKHQPSKMLRLFLEDGRKIELTDYHKIYLKGKKEKRAYEVKEGDQLTVNYNKNIEEKDIEEIFLPEIFSDRDDIMLRNIEDYLSKLKPLSKHENFSIRDSFPIKFVKGFLSKHNKSLKDLPSKVKIAIKRDSVSIPIRIRLGNELMEVIGLYIAEGYLRKNASKKGFYQTSIAGNNQIRNYVKKVFNSHFSLKPSYENSSQVVFSSRIVYELFRNYFGVGINAKSKRIPSLFLNLKKEKIAALLRGYFEGDGSVSSRDIRVTCDTVSEGLKYDLSFVLSRFSIFTKFYEYEKEPGPKVREFYLKKQKQIPRFKITKIIILSNFVKKFKQIGFISERKNRILHELCQKEPYGSRIDFDEHYTYPKIVKIEQIGDKMSYCFNVSSEHNFFANDILVHNCDGDEASVSLLMDALLNFSRQFLPDSRGSTQDTPLVLTSILVPTEVDDMVFDLDIVQRYPIEFYEATQNYELPWNVKIDKFINILNSEGQYAGIGYTHPVSNINMGVKCSSYKTIPSMEDKLKGQMELADKIRAVDATDVARLVIEKHLLRDIKGNLRKFSMQQFRCSKCTEKYRRPPLIGKCLACGSRLIFTVSEGTIIKYLEPAISLSDKYNLPPYLKQVLELTKDRVEGVFGKEKDKQEGLGRWFG
ncbi:DNA polymerase II large subunit [Candidatus Woesearchaeota archaeon]|nr:DNA polymerase II large subunit [Candidatus Woesearchaeota archaeon]